jgi:DNA-binding SARP family transcriptional activator
VALTIHLLGEPRVERDGRVVASPKGHKAWGLLSYLVLSRSPVSRRQLCSLLFADAEDPLAALRWNLSTLRSALAPAQLGGDPVCLELAPDDEVDVWSLSKGSLEQVESLGGLGQELLGSLSFATSPSYSVWLETERRHVRGATEALLHESALSLLASGDASRAADLAGQLVGLDPYDENNQALLVRSLAAAGEGIAAARQAAACRELFQRELGVEPGPALAAAAAVVTADPVAGARLGRSGVIAQLEAGEAAMGAGALEAGLQCLRRAVSEAADLDDVALRAQALTSLGSALVHVARGRDEEGATALHQAVAMASGAAPIVLARASRELGYVEFLRGSYDRVEPWLQRAEAAAGGDRRELAEIQKVRGCALSDVGRYDEALVTFAEALELSDDDRLASYVLSMIGRVHLLRGQWEPAADALDRSHDLARRCGWTAFAPWPEALRAGVDLEQGLMDEAAERLDHAFAMSCQLGDPCWEGLSARGQGLLLAAAGDVDGALTTLQDARRRGTRLPDAYLWVDAYTLDAMCQVALDAGRPDRATPWIDELADVAATRGLRELLVRALVHRGRLGDQQSQDVAATLAAELDNPLLADLVARRAAVS